MSSRSFGARVTELQDLEEAVSFHAANASQRLRKHGLFTNAVYVFIQNSPFDQTEYYIVHRTLGLPASTDCTFQIASAALWKLRKVYGPGMYYQKAGVMLMELVPEGGQQTDLFGFSHSSPKSSRLMGTLDSLNKKYGRGTVKPASEGVHKSWVMKRNL